jgi:hypothetical protein
MGMMCRRGYRCCSIGVDATLGDLRRGGGVGTLGGVTVG